jgi:hypothetical protein
MAETAYSGTAPACAVIPDTIPTTDTPTVHQDIGRVLLDLVGAMDDIQHGLTAFMNVAGDNDSEFARTAHWMVGQIGNSFDRCLGQAKAAQDAFRVESQARDRDRSKVADEAAARLRAFAKTEPEELPHMTAQVAIDGAVADAVQDCIWQVQLLAASALADAERLATA